MKYTQGKPSISLKKPSSRKDSSVNFDCLKVKVMIN